MSIKNNKNEQLSRATQLIAGTNKHFLNGGQELAFGGATRTVTATTQLLQSYVALRNATLAAQATTRTKVATEVAQTPPLIAIIGDYVAFVRATFGNQPDVLADFGLAPRKALTPPSTVKKATAAAKRTATREARHTMGKNQKKDVKGAVSATLVVTPLDGSSPVAPAPQASPAGATPAVAATASLHVT